MNQPTTCRRVAVAGLLLLLLPASARAEFFLVPFAGLKFGGSTSIVDLELAAGSTKFVLGASAVRLGTGIIGFEAEFTSISGFFENEEASPGGPLVKGGSYVTDLTGSIVFTLPPGATGFGLRPYGVVGGGLIHAEAEDAFEVFQVRRTMPAINFGGGAMGMFTNNVGVRFDLRHLRSLAQDASTGGIGRRISYTRFTTGLLLRF
jgi:hypothetical protein